MITRMQRRQRRQRRESKGSYKTHRREKETRSEGRIEGEPFNPAEEEHQDPIRTALVDRYEDQSRMGIAHGEAGVAGAEALVPRPPPLDPCRWEFGGEDDVTCLSHWVAVMSS